MKQTLNRQFLASVCAVALAFCMAMPLLSAPTTAIASPPYSSVITLADGTLAKPALAFESDKATGAYFSGSHTFVLGSNGTAKMTIGSAVTSNGDLTAAGTLTSTGLLTANAGVTLGAGSNVTLDSGTATASSGAATLNKQGGIITTESLTTAAAAAYTLTLTNSVITATSRVSVSVDNGTNSAGIPVVSTITPSSGQVIIKIYNLHASAALNGTLKISFNAWK